MKKAKKDKAAPAPKSPTRPRVAKPDVNQLAKSMLDQIIERTESPAPPRKARGG